VAVADEKHFHSFKGLLYDENRRARGCRRSGSKF